MKPHELDPLLAELGARPLPGLPGSFRQDVWREIRRRQPECGPSWTERIEQWLAALLQPQPVLASLALAVFIGVSSAVWIRGETGTKTGMDMEVFGPRTAAINFGVWE